MNVVLTASVLPHTPSDINNLLSVFLLDKKISDQKFWAACFVTKFQNCKFLGILKDKQLTVSRYEYWSITFWYPEDRHDSELNGQKVFAYETAEFTEHPAKYLKSSDNKSSTVLFKKNQCFRSRMHKIQWLSTYCIIVEKSFTYTNKWAWSNY